MILETEKFRPETEKCRTGVIFLLLLKAAERYRGAIRVKLFACFFLQIKSDFACSGIYKGKKKVSAEF